MAHIDFESDPPVIWYRFRLASGDLAFDVGANGGVVSRMLAERFKQVVSFEPCEESYQHLEQHHTGNMITDPRALSDKVALVTFQVCQDAIQRGELVTGANLPTWGGLQGERTVQATTLDQAVEQYGRPDFVKIDVEGHEVRVVQGGEQLWKSDPQVIIEIHSEANGYQILDLLPFKVDLIRHPYYTPYSWLYNNHFYLVS